MAEEEIVVPSVEEPVKETAVSPPGQPPPEADDDEAAVEADSVEVKGAKYVRIERAREASAKFRAAREEAKAARGEVERLSTVRQQLNEALPYIEALKARPDLLARLSQPAQAEEPKPEAKDDPDLTELARGVGLYDAQAQPDLEAAKRVRAFIRKEAQAIANEAVKPLEEMSAHERSAVNYQRALNIKDPTTGRTPSAETLGFMWKNMPASYSSDPRVAAIMAYAALGYDVSHATVQPKPPDKPPLETEGSGSRTVARGLSEFESKVASDRGKTEAQWKELTKGHQPGRPFVLED